ncbi:regulatory GntR family protein [Haloactinospora alba]|uniref:Regulatory GntR family protein n=1 Tax=Haloactinospora alba TaxID=405555 RepID=A0A543N927_9ACTN|nr:GntR family transcriptional regulator [Haloactinospora alba]TQN28333.1 regulatory GntR family protein [Haloactinospora alba]
MSPRATPWRTYTRIADTLRERISSGALTPGAALPSEAALGDEFGVARTTVRRALATLEAEQLIRSVPGTGRIVCTPGEQGERALPQQQPQYRRIAAELHDQISSGVLPAGAALPSESALVQEYKVSRGTARQALSELEGSGVIVSLPGKGRFVRDAGTAGH